MGEMLLREFYKDEPGDQIWWVESSEKGPLEFSFDGKTVFNFWEDYPDKLTPEQKEIFNRARPGLATLKKG